MFKRDLQKVYDVLDNQLTFLDDEIKKDEKTFGKDDPKMIEIYDELKEVIDGIDFILTK